MQNTTRYGLPQFVDTDIFNKEDINKAFNDIDVAVGDLQDTVSSVGGDGVTTLQEVITARGTYDNLSLRFGGVDSSVNTINASLDGNTQHILDIATNVKSFGAVGDGITDDTIAIQNAITYTLANGRKLYFPKGSYLVGSNITTYAYYVGIFTTITNVDGFEIIGNNATLIDGRNMTILDAHFSPVLLFSGCKNITIKGLNYRCEDTSYTLGTLLGYWGACYVMFLNDTQNVVIDYSVYNARYGIRFGDYNNPIYNGINGIVNLDVKIRANTVGYPVSIEMGNHLKIDIEADTFHRTAYLCGVTNVKLNVNAKNQYIAPLYVLLSDTSYIDGGVTKYKGCSNIEANVYDSGSTVSQTDSALFGFQLYANFATARGTTAERWSNIKLNGVVSPKATAPVRAFSASLLSSASDIFENIEIQFTTQSEFSTCYFRLTTDDLKTIKAFTIKNSSCALGYFMFTLGALTEIKIEKSTINSITFNKITGNKVYITDSIVNGITGDATGECGTLYLDNNNSIGVTNPSSFTNIFYTRKFTPINSAYPTTGLYLLGQRIINSSVSELGASSSKYVITGWICTTAGKFKTITAGTTGNLSTGTAILTLNQITNIVKDDILNIGGYIRTVISINGVDVVLNTSISTTLTNAIVICPAPTFLEMRTLTGN